MFRRTALATHLLVACLSLAPGSVALAADPPPPAPAAQVNDARTHYERGMAEYALGHYDDAIREFEAGFRIKMMPAFLFNIAQAHRKAKRPAPALEFYQRYLEMAPDSPDRADVEKAIEAAERDLAPAATAAPPPSNPPPAAPSPLSPPPAAPPAHSTATPVSNPVAPAETRQQPPDPPHRKWWPWAVAGGVAAVGIGVGLGLTFGLPDNAQAPAGVPTMGLRF